MANDKNPNIFRLIFSRKVLSSYETELKITLLLILLFLILVNFSSLRIATKVENIYKEDSYRSLNAGAEELIEYIKDNVELKKQTKKYRTLLSSTAIVRAVVIEKYQLYKSDSNTNYTKSTDIGLVRSYFDQSTITEKMRFAEGKVLRYDFGEGHNSDKIGILYSFEDANRKEWVGFFLKNASGLKLVGTVMKFNYLFQIAGILAILLVAYAYLKITLNPFKRIADEARKAKLSEKYSGESVEQVVETFRSTIKKLQEDEEKLKTLYSNSQKRAEQLEQFNQYILESMNSGLIGINKEGQVIHLNRSMRDVLELYIDTEQKSYKSLLKEYPLLLELFDRIMQEQSSIESEEMRYMQRSGLEKILGISGSPVYDHRSRFVGAILLLADLTEVRRLQNEIAFKEKMAAVGEMSAGLAHEMRNAMMAIVGYSKLLLKLDPEDEKLTEIGSSIRHESENCETMLKRFLLFAKPVAFEPEPLKLSSVAESSIQKLSELALNKNISIKIENHNEPKDFVGDRVGLDQVFTNLIKNAVEAVDDGGEIFVEIETDFVRNNLVVRISDDGGGIPDEYRDKIFSPFFTTKEKGTGLGLAIVKKLITSMGGDIEIENSTERCTTFKFMLPTSIVSDNQNNRHLPHTITSS